MMWRRWLYMVWILRMSLCLGAPAPLDLEAWLSSRLEVLKNWEPTVDKVRRSWVRRFGGYEGKMAFLASAAAQGPTSGMVLNREWSDDRGRCGVRLSHDALYVRLQGFGTATVACGAIETLHSTFDQRHFEKDSWLPDKEPVTALVDMRGASACCPRGVRKCVRFVRRHGTSLDKVAIVGDGISLQSLRLVLCLAHLEKVHVFHSIKDAKTWLSDNDTTTLKSPRATAFVSCCAPISSTTPRHQNHLDAATTTMGEKKKSVLLRTAGGAGDASPRFSFLAHRRRFFFSPKRKTRPPPPAKASSF